MKKLLYLILTGGILAGCGDVITYSNDFASAMFINASPSATGTAPLPGIHVYVDTLRKTSSIIPYRGATAYLAIAPGTRNVELRSSIDGVTKYATISGENFTANTSSSYIIYDTLGTTLRTLRLTDDLSVATTGFIKYRFLHLAVKQGPVDVTFLRTSVTPNDSVTITNQSYIGNSPSSTALSPFSGTLPIGAYTIKLKSPGTQTVLATTTVSAATAYSPYASIFTFFATGSAVGQPLSIGAVRHYP
jgi:hypothetical protein